jgi:rifampicin phosphotransferase
MKPLLDWSEAFDAGVSRCGGKGWNLARLARYGFCVPRGGVVAVETYDQVLGLHVRQAVLQAMGGLTAEAASDDATERRLHEVRDALERGRLPQQTRVALAEFLSKSALDTVPLAVRSSAVMEDGTRASFAGVHRSCLDVIGIDDIERAVLRVYASLWTPQALSYRRKMGFTDEAVRAAVVICEMIRAPASDEPACAGVGFSCDPTSGRRDLFVFHAVPGSGEKLVNGAVTPDEFFARDAGGRFIVEDRHVRSTPLLGPARREELAFLLKRVHWALGDGQDPQDIEWVHDGARFWLIQARPVTRLPRFTFGPLRSLPVYWSNGNIKDAVPGVVSTFCWSLISQVIDGVLCAAVRASGYEVPTGIEFVRRFEGRGYFDFTAVQWCLYDAVGVLPRDTVSQIGGHQPEIPVPSGEPLRGPEGARRRRALLRLAWRLWGFEREMRQTIARHLQLVRAAAPCDLASLSRHELLSLLENIAQYHDELDFRVGLANASMGGWQDALERQLRAVADERARMLMTRLLAGSAAITSAEQGYRVYELAQAARHDVIARDWLASDAPARTWADLPQGSPFRRELARFLDEFGHRGVYEADPANPRWAEDPGYILDQVQAWLREPESGPPRAAAAAVHEAALLDLRRLAPWWRRILLRWLLEKTRRGMSLRESAKSALVASVPLTRRIMLEIGRRLVEAGHLDEAAAIFELASADIACLLRGEWDGTGAASLVADRQKQRRQWLASNPPDVFVQEPGSVATPLADERTRSVPGRRLWKGTAVAPGTARGRVRVIHHPEDGRRLLAGEILVAPSTDPGWTPLFLRAAGIVMESGGYLSHGAIVAREYGLPAVVNIPGIVDQIQEGAEVRIDADRGFVELL